MVYNEAWHWNKEQGKERRLWVGCRHLPAVLLEQQCHCAAAAATSGKQQDAGLALTCTSALYLQVVAMLNGQQMGGKRRSAYFYDLWCAAAQC